MNGPKLWADMLAAIGVPGAVVAGGCIRDHHLGVAPKDIDIFVPCRDMDHWLEVKYSLIAADDRGNLHDLMDTQEGKEYEKTDFSRDKNPLYGVLEGEFMGHNINIIARTSHTSPIELIELFDFGILQQCFDGVNLLDTAAAYADKKLLRATMMHDKHVEQSMQRWLRFNTRHPGLLSLNLPFEYSLPCSTQ